MQEIISILEDKHVKSGGHRGTHFVELNHIPNYMDHCRELYRQGRVRLGQGIRGKMLFFVK